MIKLEQYYTGFNLLTESSAQVGLIQKNRIYSVSETLPDLNTTPYIYIIVDDFVSAKTAASTVSIISQDTKLPIPTFIDQTSLKYPLANERTGNIFDYINTLENPKEAIDCSQVPNFNAEGYSVLLPSWPRTLTQNQIYAWNQIKTNRIAETSNRNKTAPSFSDILGIFYKQQSFNNNQFQFADEAI